MNTFEHERTVTVLRPVGTSLIRLSELDEDDADPVEAVRAERQDELIDFIRDTIEKVADDLHLKLRIYEYDMQESIGVPSRSATKWISETNMIMTIEPTDEQLCYIMACMRKNPIMSMLLSHSNHQFIDDHLTHLLTQSAHIFGKNEGRQSRVFVLPADTNHSEKLTSVAKSALLYPFKAA